MRHACSWIILSVLFLQTCHGTSIVFVISDTGKYVVLAADSRNFADIHDPKYGSLKSDDKACKVIALGDTLFLNAGDVLIGAYRGSSWDSLQTAREIYRASDDHSAEALSTSWGNRAMTWFSAQSMSDLQSIIGPEGVLITGGFINFDSNKNPVAFSQNLLFNVATRQLSNQSVSGSKGQMGVTGIRPELVYEFKKAETPRAVKAYGKLKIHNVGKDLSYDIKFAKKAVQFVIDNVNGKDKEAVHGPIDIVVIRRLGGIDWVARKPNCYSQDFHSSKTKKPPGKSH